MNRKKNRYHESKKCKRLKKNTRFVKESTLLIYYSYTGKTKKLAQQWAKKYGYALCQIHDNKRPHPLQVWTWGAWCARTGKCWSIDLITADFSAYDKLLIMGPVWAGHPAPPVNTILSLLPPGKKVSIHLVSASGKSNCAAEIKQIIQQQQCTLSKFSTIKSV